MFIAFVIIYLLNVLGHSWVLQSSFDMFEPGHSAPLKKGPVQLRMRHLAPPPHDTLHEPHSAHVAQTPST